MGKIHFSIGKMASDSVSAMDVVTVFLPGVSGNVTVSTYCQQPYPGARVLLKIGDADAILAANPPILADHKAAAELAEKRAELQNAADFVTGVSADCEARAKILVGFLAAKNLLNRTLYPLNDKLRHQSRLTKKELVPLIDAVYAALRKHAGANASKKQKHRDFVETGSGSRDFFDCGLRPCGWRHFIEI